MKGYHTASGYMGFINGGYILFASEEEYKEYVAELQWERYFALQGEVC